MLSRAVEIGEPRRVIIVEPLEDPVPPESPPSGPDEDPEEAPAEPEKLPA